MHVKHWTELWSRDVADMSGGEITIEDKSGRSALSQGSVITPTKVKATLASIPIATESMVSRGISSMSLYSQYDFVARFVLIVVVAQVVLSSQ